MQMEQSSTVSIIERNKFCFMGLDVTTIKDGIEISMEDYVMSLEDVTNIRKADHQEELTRLEMKEY